MGEESAHQDEPELDVVREADPNISRPHGSTMRIAEETMETSIEQPRACQAASSLLRSVSLLGSTSDVVMDLTVNQVRARLHVCYGCLLHSRFYLTVVSNNATMRASFVHEANRSQSFIIKSKVSKIT